MPSNREEGNNNENEDDMKNSVTGNNLLGRFKHRIEKTEGMVDEPSKEISKGLGKLPLFGDSQGRNQIKDFEKVAKNGRKNYKKNDSLSDDKD